MKMDNPEPSSNIGEGVETISQESSPESIRRTKRLTSHSKKKDDDIVHAKGNFGTNVSDWS